MRRRLAQLLPVQREFAKSPLSHEYVEVAWEDEHTDFWPRSSVALRCACIGTLFKIAALVPCATAGRGNSRATRRSERRMPSTAYPRLRTRLRLGNACVVLPPATVFQARIDERDGALFRLAPERQCNNHSRASPSVATRSRAKLESPSTPTTVKAVQSE